jgi:VCBS repeat-containing protein
MSNTTATQILFIDSRVADSDVLLAGLDPAIEIVRLNNTESGLQQMANAVQGRSNIGSVHVISHGGPGSLLLGSGVVNQSQLAAEQLALSTLQSALSEDADLLLYGCDVAAGAEGQSFIDALAAATGADVAASTDLTGGGTAQSDWVLESSTGAVETAAIEPVGYQYDLGYWGNVGLYGDRWNVNRGSQYTIIFDADGGGKGSKYGVANNVGAYNVSNLYTSAYNGDAEAIWYTFTGSATAVPGSPWYVSNWDPDAGGYTYWGAYANSTPWQLTSSVTLTQGQSQTLFVSNLVRDDYYSSGDIWKYLVGASAGGYVSSSSLSIGNSSAKYATFYAPDVQSWKGTVYLGSITYSVNDGVDYSRGGSYNPDYFSAYSQYRSATYTTAVYGTYVDDAIVWPSAPTNQSWSNQTRNTLNYGRGAVEPDASDYVTGYHLMNVKDVTGGANTDLGTSLPSWITPSGANGNTLSVKNLAPEFANKTYQLTVEARSSADVAGTADDYLTKVQKQFTITTGTVNQLNDLPTSPGNTLTLREDRALVLSTTDFNFVDLDNTGGGSSASGARLENVRITSVPANGALKLFATASGPTVTVTTQGASGVKEVVTASFADVTTDTVIKLGTTVAKVVASATATVVAQAVAYELNNDKFSLFTATANSGTVTLTAKVSGVMTDLASASFKVLDNPGAALAADAVVTAAQIPNLVFIPTADFSGSTSFGYKVNDGYADAQSASTMNLSVTAVNDLPVFTPATALTATVYDKASSGVAIDPVSGVLSAADPEGTTVRYGIDGGVLNYSDSAVYTAPTLAVVTAGAAAVAQVTSATFAASTQATTVLFNKTSIKLGASDTAADVATKVANAISANAAEEFTATATGAVVTLTAKVVGERASLSAADFGYQTLSRQGQYGVITVDQVTGKWVYAPTQTASINQLEVDETATEVFGLTATDAAGQAAGKALTITIDGENSAPYLANALVDTTLNASRQYKLPSDAFKDVDGNTLTLSASIGGTTVPATNASGLSFDAATGTFTAAGASTTPQTIVVTATDSVSGAAVATDTFVLGNTAPTAVKPLPYKVIKTSSEVTTVTFDAKPTGATSITFDGVARDISGATSAADVASVLAGGTYSNYTVTASGADIAVTAKAAGVKTDISAANFAYAGTSSTVAVTQPVKEKTNFTFTVTGDVTGFSLDGRSYSFSTPYPATAADLATQIIAKLGSSTVYNGISYNVSAGASGVVILEAANNGDKVDLTDTTFSFGTSTATVTAAVTAQGVTETSVFTFTYVPGISTVTFKGVGADNTLDTVDVSGVTTAEGLAEKIFQDTNPKSDGIYTLSRGGVGQIIVTTDPDSSINRADLTPGAFITTFSPAISTVNVTAQGGVWSYSLPTDVFADPNGDPLTYSVLYSTDGGTNYSAISASTFSATATTPAIAYDSASGKIWGVGDLSAARIKLVANDGNTTTENVFTLSSYSTTLPSPPSSVDVSFSGAGAFEYAISPELFGLTTFATLPTTPGGWPSWVTIDDNGKLVGNPPHNASATNALALTVNGHTVTFNVAVANAADPMLVPVPLANQTWSTPGTAFSVTAGAFTDADSTITYTAFADKNRDGDFSDAGEQLTNTAGYWLQFDGASRTFSGTPDEGVSSVAVKLVGSGISGDSSTNSTTFQINLPGNVAGSLSAITVAGGNASATLTDTNAFTSGNVIYKWQTSTDAGTTWVDVASDGSRTVNAATLSLLPSEVGTQLRVNAYYTDNNGFSETVSSAASALIDHADVANQPGALTLVGDLKPGYTLFANVTDPNGLATVPTYVWYRSDSDTTFTDVIAGVTGSSYTLTSADSYKYIKVIASYQDKTSGATLTVSAVSNDLATTDITDYVGLDATEPVAINDGASITENSGLLNATVASGSAVPKTGNLFTNDTDANAKTKAGADITAKRELFKLADLRTGSIEGDGVQGRKIGTDAAYIFKLKGQYGWLEVDKSGAYSYYLDQNNTSVQALTAASVALTDVFNYEINDGDAPELLSDVGTFTLTISGANDLPTITGGIGRSSNAPIGSAAADTTAPVLSSSSVTGNKLVLKFSEGLASTDLPAASSFAVSVGGSAVAVSSVAASGSTVVLTLASAVTNGQVVTVSYTDATASNDTVALQDNNGNDVATITSASVVNKTPPASDTEAPAFVSAVLVADQLKLTFSELLNPANLPHEADFTISVAGSVLTWRDYRVVGVDEEVLTIQLNTAVTSPTTAVTVAYQDWSAGNDVNAIQDLANNDLPSLAAVTVTNQTVAVAAETFSESVSEDVATFLNTGGLVFADPDSNSITVKIEANNGARLVVPSALANLTAVWGSDTSALILKGTASALNAALAGDSVQYITSPNGTQSGNTVTISASDDGGATFTPVVTTNIAIDGKNDSIKLDLDTTNATNGYGYVALFRPRGEAVKISNANSTIYDADGTEITSATIRIASGAVDNEFGTIFETLSSSLGTTETFTWEGLTVTGNGTTDIQVTGLSTHARYKELIDSISYINANPNAYGGDRQVTIRLTDKYAVESEQLESNSALLVLATANTAVQVGQRIFIGARNADDTAWVYTDTLATVATVVNSTHFIASNNLPLLTPSSAIRFVSTGSVASSVTNSSITLGSVNSSVFAGQKIYTTAGNEIGTVLSVSGSLVNISSTYGALDVGTTIIFETAATSSVTQTSANRTVDSITSTVSSSTIVLNTIDLSIAVGQVIYEGATERGVVASVSFSGAAGGSTTVTTKAAVSDVIAADTLVFKTFATNLTPTATTTIRNVWTTEVDLNGVLETGRDYTAGFAEGQTGGTPISASSASLDNQSVYVKTVVIALTNATDGTSGGDENLFLNPAYVTALLGRGITYALSNNDHTLTLSAINQSAGVTAADMQLALRAVQYENLSQNPSVTPRIVNVTVTDITNTLTNSSLEGVAARTTINITPSNDAPTLAGDFAATVLEGGAYTLTTGDLSPSDIDNDITTLRYEVTSTSSSITVFRDTNGDGQVDAGEAIAVRNGSTAGQEFTQAEVIAGNIKVKQNGTDVSVIGLTETEAENLVNSAVYTNASANPSAGLRQVIFQNSTQMSSLGAASSAVTQTTTIDVTGTASDLFSGIDLSTPVTGDSYKTLSFKVTGVSDGINETITFGSGSTAHVVPLVLGSVVKDGAIYTIAAGSSATEFLLTVTKPFASIGLSLRDNGENGVLPVAASMNLTVTPVNDAPTFSATVAGGTFTEGGATRTLFSAAAVTDGDTSGAEQDITELKLTITGVRDGSAEKLVVDGQTISLTSGAVVGGSLGYAVTVAGSTATVTLTKTASASAWATLINGIAYQNTSNAPTNGNRVVTLTSLKDAGGTTNSGTDIKALNLSSTVTVQGIDTAPVVTSNGASVQNGGLLTITTASPVMLTATDVDSASDTLVYTLTAAATQGTLFLDKNGNSDVDEGETLVASAEFTQTDLDNGALKYFHTGNIGADAFSFRVKDATTTLSPITFDITVSAAGGVTGSGTSTANSTDGSDALFQQVAITTNTGESVKTLTFKVSGANDGSAEYLTINGQDVHLSAGSTTVGGVTYTVVDDGSGNFTVSVTSATGFTSTVANAIVNGASYGNDAVPPSTGERAISLASVTTTNGSSTFTTATNIGSVTTIAPTVDVFTAAQADAAIGTLTAGDDIKALTFTVSGVKDGANEVIKINGQEIALVAGSPVVIDGVTYQVTASTPAGTFIVTMTDATGPGLTALQAEAIVAGVTLSNSDSTPTDGARSVSLTSYSVGLASGTSITSSPTTSLASSTSSTTAVNGASVEPLSGAVITAPANVDVLTFSVSGVQDGSDEVLVIGGFSVPLVNGASLSNSNGTYAVTVTDGVATVVFTPAAALTAADAQTLVRGVDYLNNASPLTEGDRTVSLVSLSDVNSTTPIAQSATGSVSVAVVDGVYPAALPAALNLFDATEVTAAIPAPTSGNDFKSVSFNLTGIADGAQEVFQINGQDIPLVPGTVTVNGVTYTVTSSTAGSYTVTVTDTAQPGFSEAALQTMVSGATLTNTSSTATEGVRSVTLGTILQGATTSNTGTDPVALDTTAPTGSVVAPNTPVNAMAGDSVTVPTGSSVDSLTFTVTGVKDGAAEVLKFGAAPNIISVPLVNGIVASITPAGTYAVSVDSSGTATVVFTPTVELTEAQANSLITAATYTNTSNEPTGGVRSLDLTSMDVLTGSTVTTTPINSVGGDIAVQGTTEGAPVFDASDVLPTADLVGKTVDSMTFTVTGVKDGVNEVLLVNGLAVPLVPGTVTSNSPAGSYLVTVDGSGTATVVFTPTTNLTEAQANALLEGMTYDNKATDVTAGARVISLSELVTTDPDGTNQSMVTPSGLGGGIAIGQPVQESLALPLFNSTAVTAAIPAPTTGNDFKSFSFSLTGIEDGAKEVFQINGQEIPLVEGSVTIGGMTYAVTGTAPTFTVTVTDTTAPGLSETQLQSMIAGATLTNTDSTPTSGVRSVTLAAVTQGTTSSNTGSTAVTLVGDSLAGSTVAPGTAVNALTGDTVSVPGGSTVDSLTFTVTGVKDGASEVLTFGISPNTTTVPLVAGTVTSTVPAGTYAVSVDASGTATVVFTPATNLDQTDSNALIAGATYTNTSSDPTGGVRALNLTSMALDNGTAVTPTAVSTVGGTISVQGAMEGESVFNSSAVVPTLTGGKTVDSLTFGVSGVKDGSNEVLVVNGVTVPLVPTTTPISDGSGGTYSVTVDANGNAVVVYTPATNLTEAQANALLSGITYDNKASNVTDGARGFSVISMDTVDANNVTTTTATPGLDSVVSYGDVTNTAPVVSVNAGVTVAENQTVTLSASHLAVTDAQQNNLDLVFTVTDAVDRGQLFRDLNGNGLVNSGEALAVGSSFTQAELSGGSIKYRHDGSETRSDAFKFTVSDGVDTTAAQPFVISVTSVNDMPSGRPSIDGVIAQHAVLTASLTSMTDGDGLPSAASIQYTWKADGQTVGANAATYTLTADEIDKKITVSVAYTDLAGFSHTVTSLATAPVVNVNDAPTLSDSTLTVFEGGTITFNTSQIVAADQDGLTLDHQFKLVTAPTKGQIYLDANGNGMLDTGSESVLATNGTFTQDDLFNGRVRYQHLGSEDSDGFGLQAIDAGGLSSATAAFTVTRTAVNDAPTFQNLDGDVIAVPTAGVPVLLDRVATGLPAAVVADVDSTDLAGGQLRVAVNFNRNPAKDSLAIKQVGTGTGQISTDAADVKFGAITIGTFAGGSGANDLLITFNGSATKEAIAALVSAITFQNDESIPAESVRTVAFTLTDGDGGTSDVARVTVNLEANGAPIFLNANTSVAVFENNTQVGVFAATDPLRLVTTYSISSRDDSANADRTKFAINATTGVLTFVSAPDFETPTDAGSDNHYNVVVRATNANGYSEMPVEVAIIDQVTGTGEVAVDRTSPTYVMGTLSGNTLILYFSEATSLNAVNKPDRLAFTVTAGNTAVGIAALAVNATAKTVTLTLETALSSVTGLTVAYADPTAGNDTAALQDIAGNDAASFSVSNIVLMTGGGGSGGATGVTPVIENQVTSLAISGAVAGDGNGDGIADANQSAVASVPMMITSLPESAPNNSAMTYITLVAASISGKVGASELTQITEITQRDMPANVPTAVDMPMGLIDFTATVAVAGGTSTFSLYVDSTLSFNGYWKQNSEGVWTNLASAAYGGSITEEGGKLRIDFTIKDGGEFDEDGLANGVIVDPGAIGTVPLSIVGMYAERPEGEGWF